MFYFILIDEIQRVETIFLDRDGVGRVSIAVLSKLLCLSSPFFSGSRQLPIDLQKKRVSVAAV